MIESGERNFNEIIGTFEEEDPFALSVID